MNLESLVRKNIWKLQPYSSARHEFVGEAEVFLDANENPYGGPYSRYPDPLQSELKEIIASTKGVNPNQIFIGNGSDEAIDLLFRIFCEPAKDEVLILPPTYGMYKVSADIADVKVKESYLSQDFQLNITDIKNHCSGKTKILFICSPNNPTGNCISATDIAKVFSFFKGIVVIDEAYIDFSEYPSWITQLNKYPNLVVLQTLSKAWGLAGIRMGLAFSSPEIIALFNKVKPPYNVNKWSQRAAISALSENARDKEIQVAEIISERDRLKNRLLQNNRVLQVFPSDANFLLVKFDDPLLVFTYFKEQGVVVRDRSKTPLCDGCLRITIGTPSENNLVIESLNQLM